MTNIEISEESAEILLSYCDYETIISCLSELLLSYLTGNKIKHYIVYKDRT